MRLPDADGFIVAAQMATEGYDVVYLHNAEGAPVAALMPFAVYKERVSWEALEHAMPNHYHLEPDMGTEVPWMESAE